MASFVRATASITAAIVWVMLACLIGGCALAQEPENIVENGGFEKGASGWMWQQWEGKPLPGYIDRDDMHEGLASFKFHQDGASQGLRIAKQVRLEPGRDYVLSMALKPEQMPEGSARVRLLIDGRGWHKGESGALDVIKTGGTHDWRSYTVRIPAAALGKAERLTIYIFHDKPSQGTLGVDAVSIKPAARSGAAVRGSFETVTYTTDIPVVLVRQRRAAVAIRASPDRALYREGELPAITVESAAAPDAKLIYRVIDGFGTRLLERAVPADRANAVQVSLPAGHGYYEIIAFLERNGERIAEARRSVGALPPPAKPVGDEPFGLWIQGEQYYPELGVRWIRDGIVWDAYRRRGDAYLRERAKFYDWCRRNNIRVIAFPKGHPRPYEISREVIADTPEAWKAEEEWWTRMVRTLAGHVDAWGVVNEPMRGHWRGNEALIVRYWALMRKIVGRYDPDTPLIGPSLSPNTPTFVEQYRDLLAMGFGKYIDAVEMHTYITSPEDNDWAGNTRRIAELTRKALGKDLPIWSTEHGTGASYETELHQAQYLMRSWLEAKRIGYPVMIWHMFSHPQGANAREVNFGIFRNVRERIDVPPQPRPAGVAYGVMTRQLAGAKYRTKLDYLGPSINAYVFERHGKAMVALWTTSQKSYDVTLAAGDERNVTVTGLFGRTEPLAVEDGVVRVTVDRNPKIIAPLPAFYLQTRPVAKFDRPVELLPGQSTKTALTLTNATKTPAKFRIEWLPSKGWRFALAQNEWSLRPGESIQVPVTATAPKGLPIGRYQVHAKVFRDRRYVTSLTAEASVLPEVTLAAVEPRFQGDRPVVAGTLRRLDPTLRRATVQLDDEESAPQTVNFGSDDTAQFALPAVNTRPDRLNDLTLVVRGAQGKVQSKETLRLSFVPADRVSRQPVIDGDLADWPQMKGGEMPAIRWGWDESNLYLAVRVADPKHIQNQAITQMWKDDSLQIGIAPEGTDQLVRDFRPGLHEAEMAEFDVALRADGPAMYRHRTMNQHMAPTGEVSQKQIRYAVRHRDGVLSYELQIPVAQIGLKPLRGGEVLRAALLVNANEGDGRRTTEWFEGIRTAKDPSLYGHVILRD